MNSRDFTPKNVKHLFFKSSKHFSYLFHKKLTLGYILVNKKREGKSQRTEINKRRHLNKQYRRHKKKSY